jgi:hypothetical protein
MFQFSPKPCVFSAIWLLFLNTTSSLQEFFANVNIPFNCEFLVAQKEEDDVVVLTEVYRVSPSLPLQTYRFCNWSANSGLTCSSVGLYQRRGNLEGLVLITSIKAVSLSVL